MNRRRLRDWGIAIGELPTGPHNKLSDVPGVTVGHATVADSGHNTGLTVILPAFHSFFPFCKHRVPRIGRRRQPTGSGVCRHSLPQSQRCRLSFNHRTADTQRFPEIKQGGDVP